MTTLKRHGPMFLNIAEHLLKQGFCVQFHAEGTSMRPAIEHGDVITVGPVDPAAIAAGDIVLYRHRDRPIAHRVAEIYTTGQGEVVVVPRGDGKRACDAPVQAHQVMGKVVAIERCAEPTIAAWLSSSIERLRRVATALLQDSAGQ